jgi:hypothetical protein
MARKNTQASTTNERDAVILDACRAALGLTNAMRQVKDGKSTLTSMADRLAKAGVTLDAVKAARESFSLTLHSVLGLPAPERAKGTASTDAVVRALVKGMADAVGIDAPKLSGAVGTQARKDLYAAPMKALQRLAPKQAPKTTKPADVYEAAQHWGERLHKEFTSFRPKAVNDKEFQRFAQVLFDAITMEAEEAAHL